MKMNKETKQLLGLSAVISAFLISFAFIVLAVRKKSILGAVLAISAAAGSAVGTGALLGALFAPDTEGESVPSTMDADDETELFDADEAVEAACIVRHVLGGKRDGETVQEVPSVRPQIPQDDEMTEADFMA